MQLFPCKPIAAHLLPQMLLAGSYWQVYKSFEKQTKTISNQDHGPLATVFLKMCIFSKPAALPEGNEGIEGKGIDSK